MQFASGQDFGGRRVALGNLVSVATYDGSGTVVATPAVCVGFQDATAEPVWLFLASPARSTPLKYQPDATKLDIGEWCWTPRV